MIAPRPRLLIWVAAIGLPAALLAISPPLRPLAAAIDGALVLAAVCDAVLARRRIAGLAVEAPDVVRLIRGRRAEIPVDVVRGHRDREGQGVGAPRLTALQIAIGLVWPPEIGAETEVVAALVPAGAPRSRVLLACTPERRGRYALAECRLETASPLGWWAVRGALPLATEVRVYPDLMEEQKSTPALFLHRGGVGLQAHRQVGKGREFERLREYQAGDSYDELHWKATAKRGRPVTKLFQVERTQEVYVVLDTSRLAARPSGTPPRPALERTLNAGLLLGLAAERQGDLFGAVAFADQVHQFVPARGGKQHFQTCRQALFALQPTPVAPDFEELATFLRLRLRRRALLVVLTALDDAVLAESFMTAMRLLCRQHLIVVCTLRDPAVAPLFSADARDLDELTGRLAGHLSWEAERELAAALAKHGVGFAPLAAEALAGEVVSRYAEVKRRQIL